jgi:3-(methylthio)propanoyl-CoA dehydrogenase
MTPFRAPVADIVAALAVATKGAALPDWDAGLAEEILGHFAGFAEGVIAPLDAIGDQQGCRLAAGRVHMPDGFRAAYADYAAAGWPGLTIPVAFGGQGLSPLLLAGVSEVFSGANHALQMVTGLVPGATRTLLAFGTQDQQARWLPRLASGELLATMCLTEAGAGSDLSRVQTRATPEGDSWRISGEKIFISGGDQDLSDGILHLVLARTGTMDDGTRGLSLFLCPSSINGERNAVQVTRIEEKMGLHASPTCQMKFDAARAELVGAPGAGLQAMFTMMNHARIDVALQGVAHAARAHDIARSYARERLQGRGPDGPVTIDAHPAVQAMLAEQRGLALGGRMMCLEALVALETGNNDLADFLTPVCKVFCTEAGLRAADLGIQILGGYGYLRDYRVEQTWRDARITAIYEGTNEIHALTLATRLLRQNGGVAPQAFEQHIGDRGDPALLAQWQAMKGTVLAAAQPETLARGFIDLTGRLAFSAASARLKHVQ